MPRSLSFVVAALIGSLSVVAAAQSTPPEGTAPRDIVIGASVQMPSRVFGGPIRLDIALPPGYDGGSARYPVLFAFQSHFAGVSGMVGALSYAGVAPSMIVVSAGFDPVWFSLYAKEQEPGSGRADFVLQSIQDELVPFVESHYRTLPYRIFLGHSSSSLFLLYGMFTSPDVMQAVLAAGPMFAEVDYTRVAAIFDKALATRPARTQFLFYTQGDQPELTQDLASFGALLAARRPPGLTWQFDPEPEANHSSLHIKTLYDGLRILFADWATLPESVAIRGSDAIRAYKKELADRFGYDIGLGRLADAHLRVKWATERNIAALVALAKYNCGERPADFRAQRELAQAYEQAGRWNEAVAAWERCIATATAHETPETLARILPGLEARLAFSRNHIEE